ncbi:MAG TPA: molybdate ABC transporter substrate-binding protein [Polyangiaceae bacterium]|nr:molybdate ABC transporter substrate-binding protein [Polyangiaceae bacterium]
MIARSARRSLLLCCFVTLAASCATGTKRGAGAPEHELTVFAAASLREAFTALGQRFEALHAGTHVVLSFAGSQTLRSQIEHGAPADVFASADERHMSALAAEGHVTAPKLFAQNELVVAVSRAQAGTLREFRQLPAATRIVLGAPEVPIGEYTRQALERANADLGADFRARVEAHVVSREPDVRQVLAKIALGEADAGIVYRTDALAAKDKVALVPIPAAHNVLAKYPVAVAAHAPEADLGRAFVELLLSADGARILADNGFLPVHGAKADAR